MHARRVAVLCAALLPLVALALDGKWPRKAAPAPAPPAPKAAGRPERLLTVPATELALKHLRGEPPRSGQ